MSSKSGILAAAALAAAPVGSAWAGGAEAIVGAEPNPLAIVSVYDLAKDAFASSTALYFALNRDLAREGVIVRLSGSMDSYSYDVHGSPWDTDGDAWAVDAMLGYRWIRGDVASSLLLGAEHQDHDLSPDDPFNPVRGSETGFKVAFNVTKAPSAYSPLYAELAASYSTAFDTYQVDGRVGLAFDRFIIGPEAWVMGDDASDAQRVGGFLKTELPPLLFSNVSTALTLSVGYQFVDDDHGRSTFGSDGAYGSARLTTLIGQSWFDSFR